MLVMVFHNQDKAGVVCMMQVGWMYDTIKAEFVVLSQRSIKVFC